MTIYVDKLRSTSTTGKWRYRKSCHMFMDPSEDISDLIRFGMEIGMRPSWLHNAIMPHFDLTENKRRAAVSKGAIEVDRYRTNDAIKAWRKFHMDRIEQEKSNASGPRS